MESKQTKKCYKCKTLKTIDDFYSNRARGDGLSTYCKDCNNIYAHQLLRKAAVKRYVEKYPEKIRARSCLGRAIRSGKITAKPCEIPGCGSIIDIEAHHPNYFKPLDVRWLCRFHHKRVDLGELKLEKPA